jgi:hypothetical protein
MTPPYADRAFERIEIDHSDTDWIFCRKEGVKFEGDGDPQKLGAILEHFLSFVEAE